MTNIKKWFSHHLEDNAREGEQFPKYYWNPYLVGIGLGIVLLASFVIMGRGLGASGALSTTVSVIVNTISPEHAANSSFYSKYLGDGLISPFKDWLVFLIIGVFFGGFISGAILGRNKLMIEKGPNISNKKRLIFAFIGGTLMGFGAKMARGCTSGQGLTGGAMLSVGGWAFMLMVFIGGYATAYFVRRQWI
ncbi:MAG: YeeE/YedE thiosulfate transporter family protein [Ignavibacteria bacterium]|jgi:uncharacterized membrane protein YedE/YeeE